MVRGVTAGAVLVALVGGASPRADLVESAASVAQNGASLRVTDVVRNAGAARAPASTTAYFLSGERIGSRPVRALAPRAVSRGTTVLTIPSSVRPGSWRLRVCADARGRVEEANERNNCRFAARRVLVGDVTAPRFAGLDSATTCIPGPVGLETRYTPYGLRWHAASDDRTPAAEIVYDIYEAHSAGGEDFSKPTYTTPPGATSFATPPLPDDVPHYFVVRAVDRAGNRDHNKVERLGENLCL